MSQVCYKFQTGSCTRGDTCKFLHVIDANVEAPKKRREHKSKGICFAFQRGECDRGDTCKFRHELQEKARDSAEKPISSSKVCIFARQGRCKFGDSCRFSHVFPRVELRKNGKVIGRFEDAGDAHDKFEELIKDPNYLRVGEELEMYEYGLPGSTNCFFRELSLKKLVDHNPDAELADDQPNRSKTPYCIDCCSLVNRYDEYVGSRPRPDFSDFQSAYASFLQGIADNNIKHGCRTVNYRVFLSYLNQDLYELTEEG